MGRPWRGSDAQAGRKIRMNARRRVRPVVLTAAVSRLAGRTAGVLAGLPDPFERDPEVKEETVWAGPVPRPLHP